MEQPVAELASLLGPSGWLPSTDATPWQRDWLNRYGETPLGVARPRSTEEVSRVVKLCRQHGLTVVPQGGNTSLCGGAVLGSAGGVVLSLSRMNAIGAIDPASGSATVDAGVVLEDLHAALDGSGLMFPMHLGSGGSAQIGGIVSTNAGGSHAFRYGMMSDLVLGLEVVLADGAVWNGLRSVQKDNAGYQLRRLFCGAEGTLGVMTKAVLRLVIAPRRRVTMLLAMPDLSAAIAFGVRLRTEAAEFMTALEFFSDFGLRLVEKHVAGASLPLETRGPVYLLAEAASSSDQAPLDGILGALLEAGLNEGLLLDGALAASEAQRAAFWRLREEQPEGQRMEGPQLKHDISVPPSHIADFVAKGVVLCERLLPGVRINPFGHLADGNIHYNLTPPKGAADFGGQTESIALALARLASEFGGSFAAEHGLGRSKVALADTLRPASERSMMRSIKAALDPEGLFSPGVIISV